MEFIELHHFEEFKKFELKIAMYNRCPHFYGGILPISRRKLILCFVVKTSAVLAILFLVILPETSIAAAPKYETAYACEGKTLTIECEPGYFISLIRANYGRFSITICNDHGNVEWSVNCMFPKSLKVLSSKCAHKQNCSVFASTNIFGDPCPGTHKYLEAHYQCVSASQTSTTTSRPSPPWLITNQPNSWSTSTVREVITTSKNLFKSSSSSSSSSGGGGVESGVGGSSGSSSSNNNSPSISSNNNNNNNNEKEIHLVGKPPLTIDHNNDESGNGSNNNNNSSSSSISSSGSSSNSSSSTSNDDKNETAIYGGTRSTLLPSSSSSSSLSSSSSGGRQVQSSRINDSLEIGIINSNGQNGVSAVDDQQILRQSRLTTTSLPIGGSNTFSEISETRRTERQKQQQQQQQQKNLSEDNSSNKNYELYTTQSSLLVNKNNINNNNNNNNNNHNERGGGGAGSINGLGNGIMNDNNYYCGPTTARNLFWNITKAGEVNVQPCPGGATGIAKWRCVLLRQPQYHHSHYYYNQDNYNYDHGYSRTITSATIPSNNSEECDKSNNNNCNNSNNSRTINNSATGAGILSSGINQQQPYHNFIEDQHQHQTLTAWHPKTPDLTQCRSLWLNNLEIRVNQRDSSLISIANDLSQVTSSKTLYGGDMLVTTKIIQTMSEKMSYDIETFPDQKQREAIIYELLHGVVKTGSNLLDISQQVSWLDLSFEDQMRVATSLLTGIEDNAFLLAVTITRERNVVQKVKNILLSIRILETRNIISNEIFPDAKIEQWHVSDDRIELPRGALIENSEGGLVRIVFVAFDRLESILKPSFNNLDLKFSTNYVQNSINNNSNPIKNMRILNSKVISASLGKGRHIQLSQPIRLVLRHLKLENVTNPTCVFWNYIDHAWSEDGCYLEETNRTHTICMCNHLTNFAILMDIIDEHHNSLLSIFDNNMKILIYISIAICLIFIIIAILTLKLFNGIFIKSTQTSIYKNIYVCLFIIETLFLIGIEQSETSILCGFTTAFLHCFLLSAMAWLCFEGFQIYLTLTTDDMLLEVGNSSKIIWYYLLSYGLSLTIVAISLVINPSTYTQGDFCVLMESNGVFYTAFIAPIGFFVMGAIAYMFVSCYMMCKKNKSTLKTKEHTRLTNVKFDLQCFFIFLSIVSSDWIFSYIYLRKVKHDDITANTYGNLFVIFNSFLGIYIFVFHCIQNEKIRREYRKYMRQNTWLPKCLRCSKTSSITSSASHTQHNPHFSVSLGGGTGGSGVAINGSGSAGNSVAINGVDDAVGDVNITNKSPILKASPLRKDSNSDQSSAVGVSIEPSSSTMATHRIQMSGNSSYPSQTQILSSGDPNLNSVMSRVSNTAAQSGHKLILERTAGGTMKSLNAGYSSPTSSSGSTHLIYNSMQNDQTQDWNYPQSESYFAERAGNDAAAQNLNVYDDKFLYYDFKSTGKRSKHNSKSSRGLFSSANHDIFYWTGGGKNNRKNLNSDFLKQQKSPDKQQQQQQQIHGFYPSYKKSLRKRLTPAIDNEKLSDSDLNEAEIERRFLNYPPSQTTLQMTPSSAKHYQSHQMMMSNEDLADTNLIPPHSGGSHMIPNDHHFYQTQQQQQHHHQLPYNHHHHPHQYRSKQTSNSCDFPDEFSSSSSCRMSPCGVGGSGGGGSYYHNQESSSSGMHDEPVYEEILSNHVSDKYDNNDDERGGENSGVCGRNDDIDDYDDEDDVMMIAAAVAEEERLNRIRRMMVKANNPDDDLRQPFNYNQQRYKSLSSHRPNNLNIDMTTMAAHHHQQPDPSTLSSHFKQQQQQQQHQSQTQLQQLQQHQPHQQQQIVSRNLSAMLDENNTVVCYLEPLPK